MKKILIVTICVLVLSFTAFAEWNYSIEQDGSRVEVREYNRIISLSPGAVEVMYMIGAQDKLLAIGTSRSGIWPQEETSLLDNVGSITKPSLEKVVALEPDLVILNSMSTEFAETLEQHGIPYLLFATDSLEAMLEELPVFGVICGRPQEAIKLSAEKFEKLDSVREKLEEKPLNLKGAFLYTASPIQGFNEESLPGQILEILGCENMVSSTMARPILTPEYVVEQNPDFLFGAMAITKAEDITNSNPLLLETRAGKEGNVYLVPSQKILRPTPRVIDFIEELYEQLSELTE
ncbi:MAG TPA: ABC transporter substrate-binding protein [Thermotogota bacterium]|nr:ABC transporter substrate-binding protein [Thermotogota bacterium]